MPLRPDRRLDHFKGYGDNSLPGYMGLRIVQVEENLVVAELDVRPQVMAPNGFLHAGTIVTLADTACGYACIAHLPEGANNFTTIELKANFLGTAREGIVRAEARAVHLGRSTQLWDAEVKSVASGKAIAHFRCTQMVLYPR